MFERCGRVLSDNLLITPVSYLFSQYISQLDMWHFSGKNGLKMETINGSKQHVNLKAKSSGPRPLTLSASFSSMTQKLTSTTTTAILSLTMLSPLTFSSSLKTLLVCDHPGIMRKTQQLEGGGTSPVISCLCLVKGLINGSCRGWHDVWEPVKVS